MDNDIIDDFTGKSKNCRKKITAKCFYLQADFVHGGCGFHSSIKNPPLPLPHFLTPKFPIGISFE